MPELPEVETVVRDLRPLLVGRAILSLQKGGKKLRRPWMRQWEASLLNRTVQALERRGKWIIIQFNNDARLVVHLGMTGQLTVVDAAEPLPNHVHFVFSLSSTKPPQELRFRDVRRFGSLTLFESSQRALDFFAESGLGPEPFDLEPQAWRSQLAGTRRCLKAVLLDQRIVAGVGNIYADEALFHAKLHPARLANALTARETTRLRRGIVAVLTRAIERRGSTIRDYVGGSGLMGKYQNEFQAYGRTGEPCSRCRRAIEQIRLAGRSTHYCPRCQEASR